MKSEVEVDNRKVSVAKAWWQEQFFFLLFNFFLPSFLLSLPLGFFFPSPLPLDQCWVVVLTYQIG
jgi:hypothetical protein